MANKITFTTEDNQTKATFDYDNLQDIQVDAIKRVLGITPSGKIDITNTQETDVTNYAIAQVVDNNLVDSNIKKDVTILGVTGILEEGGPQPTLFAPVITGAVNEVSWTNDTRNGGFQVTITATVDGQTVTSPLTITEQMDGKTLTITASATNFQDATTTEVLSYVSGDTSVLAGNRTITSYLYRNANPYQYIKWYYNGQEISNNTLVATFEAGSDTKTLPLYGVVLQNNPSANARDLYGTFFSYSFLNKNNTGTQMAILNGTITVYNKTKDTSAVLIYENHWNAKNTSEPIAISTNDVITILFNATVS